MGRKVCGLLVALVVGVLAWVASSASSGAPAASPPAGRAPAAEGPNVVLILTDDMRADELRYLPKTNRLLVDRGVRFRNAISPHPLCCPARAGLFTGQYGHNNGVQHNSGPWGGSEALRDRDVNLGAWLTAAGYSTAYHGKFLNGWNFERWLPAGWTRWDATVRGAHSYRHGEFYNGDSYDGGYVARVVSRRALRAMEKFHDAGRPFVSIVNHVAPHVKLTGDHMPDSEPKYRHHYSDLVPPWLDHPVFDERDVSDLPNDLQFRHVRRDETIELFRARLRALRSVDDAVAATVRHLDRLGILDETYIVFTSDNGLSMGEHRADRKNVLFDESLDVPLVVRGPGVPRGRTVDDLVSLVDLPATILDWTDTSAGRTQDGLSLARLTGRGEALQRDTVLVQTGDTRVNSTPGWNYRGVTTSRYLYARKVDQPDLGILFDRRRDPWAMRNRYGDRAYRAVQRELEHRTRELEGCSGAGCNQWFGRLPQPS